MLILTRGPNENIVITADGGIRLEVHVISVQGKQVRLGIAAPDDVLINRQEIQAQLEQNHSR